MIDGFEKGVADSPELGLASIQGGNITSIPGEVSVSFATAAGLTPPTGVTGASFSAVGATDVVTVSSTSGYYNGMAVKIDTSSSTTSINALLVAGGGGGATANLLNTGGGAGGQVLPQSSVSVAVGAYSIVVGAGGSSGGPGTNSTGFGFTSVAGASGLARAGGASGSGNAGGGGSINGSLTAGGGGGGDTTIGGNGSSPGGVQVGGTGGNGTASSISGAPVTYAGGGGGGSYNTGVNTTTPGVGGTGGGGTGGYNNGSVVAATAGSAPGAGGGGSGGQAVSQSNAGSGADGIVIISYPTGSLTATGGSITTSGGNTIHSFTAAGTSTFTVTAVNPQVGNIYYVGNLSGNTFKLYYDLGLTSLVNVLMDLTGTYDVISFGTPQWSAYYQYYASATSAAFPFTFILDNPGNCWYLRESAVTATGGTIAANTLQYTGNTGHAASGTNADFGLTVWKNYLLVIVGKTVDYISIPNLVAAAGPNGKWTYAWKIDLTYTNYQHQTLSATDDAVYICNANTVASLLQKAGQTFDPTNTATYTWNTAGLTLSSYDEAMSIAQLGTLLLVGGIQNYIYPWDRVSTSFNYPLVCADRGIYRIVSTNSNAYVFAGTRGRIYIANGVQIQLYKEIPDSFSGDPEPYYTWQDAIYLRNKLYFTFTGTTNGGAALTSTGGIWALGIDAGQTEIQVPTAGSLFNINQLSYGSYAGSCPVLIQSMLTNPGGYGIGGAWTNSGANGFDMGSSLPYTSYQTVIRTDIIPIGTLLNPSTNRQMEYKLAKPLVAGEKVRVSWRGDLASSFVQVWESTATGKISDYSAVNFEKQQWVQFQVELSSTVTTPSYVRFRELRLR